MEEGLEKILEEFEVEGNKPHVKFRSFINQPELITINSINSVATSITENPQVGNGFYDFTINLPRPALDVESLQLLKANIPQAQACIPDYSTVFYYYKLKTQTDVNTGDILYSEQPNIKNLYMIRFLPSWYKKELIVNPTVYGYNRTFTSYADLVDELKLACAQDLATTNIITYASLLNGDIPRNIFIQDDITFDLATNANKIVMTGNNVSNLDYVYALWDTGSAYPINRIVEYEGLYYISNIDANITNVPGVSPTWEEYTIPSIVNTYLIAGYDDPNVKLMTEGTVINNVGSDRYYMVWNPYNLYEETDYTCTIYNNKLTIYQAVIQNQNQPILFTEWSADVLYKVGDIVSYLNVPVFPTVTQFICYRSTVGGINNKGLPPYNNASYWLPLYNVESAAWVSATTYTTGSTVSRPGYGNYVSLLEYNVNWIPELYPAYWLFTPYVYWLPATGSVNPDYYLQPTVSEWSRLYDFTITGISNIVSQQGLVGNTLAKRIGFTWSSFGFNPAGLMSSLNTTNPTSQTFLNRLRPIPDYQSSLISPPPAGWEASSYTADGYCNLVYSSIISIYTTIIGTSSVDSVRNANLLGVIPLDCGNLGVTFAGNYIENALTKINKDIYSIYIELRDENGQPYYLTYNAIVSLILKLTYKI
jgi:hypothetical protein